MHAATRFFLRGRRRVAVPGRANALRRCAAAAAIGVATGLPWASVQAEIAKPAYPDFTFRRVAVPGAPGAPGAPAPGARRITVQIDPAEQAARLAALPKPSGKTWAPPPGSLPADAAPGSAAVPAAQAAYDWYWDAVPAGLAARDGRFDRALAALTQGPQGTQVATPGLQSMQDIAAVHGTEILKATIGTRVSPALVLAVIGIESAGRVDAVSSAGAQGLMQLIPATAERFGVADSRDPAANIRGGVAYLDWLMAEFEDDPLMVLAAYNAGENAVRNNAGVPPFAETRDYVPKVLAAWQVARGLCRTPPELMTDGCVFTVGEAG